MNGAFRFAGMPDIVFGRGRFRSAADIARGYGETALLVTGRVSYKTLGCWDEFTASLDAAGVTWARVTVGGEPSPEIIDEAVSAHRGLRPSVVVAVGGGSVMDAGKAISAMLRHEGSVTDYLEGVGVREPTGAKVPFVAVPTTSGTGSESTRNAVISRVGPGGFKKSLRHRNFVPDIALIDPDLMVTCPRDITAACGMDAFTQLLESYVSTQASPMTDALAFSGMQAARDSLEAVCGEGADDPDARAGMAYAALMSGVTLANAGLGVVHGVAGPLGGMFPVPHGAACGTLLAAATAATIVKIQNRHGSDHPALEKYAAVGAMLRRREAKNTPAGCEMLLQTLNEWTGRLDMPGLLQFGVTESDLDAIAAASDSKCNPEPLSRREIVDILRQRL
jgi:alcohol dehydrogenase class IV